MYYLIENRHRKQYARRFHRILFTIRKKVERIALLASWSYEELWNRGWIRWRERRRLWLSILLLSRHEESVIAFMGEEKVLRGGDNVLAATTEASLSEIKHDATEGRIEGRRGGVKVPPSRPLDFPLQRFLLHITSD